MSYARNLRCVVRHLGKVENLAKAVSMAFIRTCENADYALTLIKVELTCESRHCGNSVLRVLNSVGISVKWFAGGDNLQHDAAIDLARDAQWLYLPPRTPRMNTHQLQPRPERRRREG